MPYLIEIWKDMPTCIHPTAACYRARFLQPFNVVKICHTILLVTMVLGLNTTREVLGNDRKGMRRPHEKKLRRRADLKAARQRLVDAFADFPIAKRSDPLAHNDYSKQLLLLLTNTNESRHLDREAKEQLKTDLNTVLGAESGRRLRILEHYLSEAGHRFEGRQYWDPTYGGPAGFTDPAHHDPRNYRYLIHSVNDNHAIKMRAPETLLSYPPLSLSLVSNENTRIFHSTSGTVYRPALIQSSKGYVVKMLPRAIFVADGDTNNLWFNAAAFTGNLREFAHYLVGKNTQYGIKKPDAILGENVNEVVALFRDAKGDAGELTGIFYGSRHTENRLHSLLRDPTPLLKLETTTCRLGLFKESRETQIKYARECVQRELAAIAALRNQAERMAIPFIWLSSEK